MPVTCATETKSISPIATKRSYMVYMPAVLVAAGIAVLSLLEKQHVPPVGTSDKLAHGLSYAVLAGCLMGALLYRGRRSWRWILLAIVSTTAYGLLMEVLQRFCTLTRSGEVADLTADLIGAVIGVTITLIISRCLPSTT